MTWMVKWAQNRPNVEDDQSEIVGRQQGAGTPKGFRPSPQNSHKKNYGANLSKSPVDGVRYRKKKTRHAVDETRNRRPEEQKRVDPSSGIVMEWASSRNDVVVDENH